MIVVQFVLWNLAVVICFVLLAVIQYKKYQ